MEEFADLLREIQSGSDEELHSGKAKRSKKHSKKAAVSPSGDRMSAELLENQQLSFQLASDVRSLRQQLADEKQSKRLLAATNASLESQLSKMEQKHATMEQALRLSEQKRFELQRQLDAEKKQLAAQREETQQFQAALQRQRAATAQQALDVERQQTLLRQQTHEHDRLVQYAQALELAFNEVVAEQRWQQRVTADAKAAGLVADARVEQLQRRLLLLARAWSDVLAPFDGDKISPSDAAGVTANELIAGDGADATDRALKQLQQLLGRTQLRLETLHRRRRRSQRHVRQLLALVSDLEADLPLYAARRSGDDGRSDDSADSRSNSDDSDRRDDGRHRRQRSAAATPSSSSRRQRDTPRHRRDNGDDDDASDDRRRGGRGDRRDRSRTDDDGHSDDSRSDSDSDGRRRR